MTVAGTLAHYLPTLTPDRDLTLSFIPDQDPEESGTKNIKIIVSDGGQEKRVILSDTPVFYVTISLSRANLTDARAIVDMWADQDKADGAAYTFKWEHPDVNDGNIYVVRFASDLSRLVKSISRYGFGQVKLRVLGVAP